MRRQYPSVASNLLKMYVDVELFLVTLVGLILRLENADLGNDPLPLGLRSLFPDSCGWLCTGTLYGDLLWILLLLTLLPALVAVIHRSPEEKAQANLPSTSSHLLMATVSHHFFTSHAIDPMLVGEPSAIPSHH